MDQKKKPYHHGDLRNAVIDAALRLIQTQGAGSWTMREIAKEAGVSVAAPYRHFKDKNAVLCAVAEQGFLELDAVLSQARQNTSGDAMAQVRALVHAYLQFAKEHPERFAVMFDRTAQEVAGPAAARCVAAFEAAITAWQAAGNQRNATPHELATVLWAAAHGLATIALANKGAPGLALSDIGCVEGLLATAFGRDLLG